ncbi:glucose-6-phosphate dehydrogenase [Pyrinomonas methylaliphatogenes]|nr:glucose-6-phosphate dehydrogenase [Pyrinomonas methylaliphatogenes]MBX5478491.1 glucose-6-phosphate dehydrogenase [Pyrinomonas methylaliphatogenes]
MSLGSLNERPIAVDELSDNPLREGLKVERAAGPCAIIIFGASGDLTRRKLIPALYRLAQRRLLSPNFAVLGIARTEMSDEEFRQRMRDAVIENEEQTFDERTWQSFASGLRYEAADLSDAGAYTRMIASLQRLEGERQTEGNRLFYLATAPELFSTIIERLGECGLTRAEAGRWTRIIIEKPFGYDLASARELNARIARFFGEDQIYRIDHYLGKETVQNLFALRFANSIFESVWNRNHIDHVQITNAETLGVEGRGGYYERAGALRDMIQSHVLQVVSLIAMEPPTSLSGDDVRDEKMKALAAVRPIKDVKESAVRGQYGPGFVLGERVVGYREEPGVDPQSTTETFAALKLQIDNWRWAGVPFYVRSGKRLPKRVTEVAIRFKDVPHNLFTANGESLSANLLIIRIQPNEGITLRFNVKLPGQAMRLRPVNMDFRYSASFGITLPEAYERLLLDCMLGEATLFARRDMIERSWEIVMPVLEAWAAEKPDFPNYAAGTWGPQAADELIERDGRRWRRL